ncbi:GIY-YIG nuclease family protein [Rhizobium sp. S163]|uniref:GIY-YIG nuclease family protein n=1 Tax=Rhizobium sp. S163 TaxID=3055039 RepID=UPI0025A967F5|nr:GIY-YIG nuclease family protein [Rhizobium sp. S163]MDM9645563.1 GIY-YIG nuclease family protein [Rhizobium sp. S163]
MLADTISISREMAVIPTVQLADKRSGHERVCMIIGSYYVYALKDPRAKHAQAFYIGKGTGVRRYDHLKADNSRKGERIKEIVAAGQDVLVTLLADDLSELQALKLEAELISAFGTIDTGGILLNSVVPTGRRKSTRSTIIVPSGVEEKAQLGLKLLKEAVLELAKANGNGVMNSDCVKALGLASHYMGGSKDYLTWSLLGLLMQEGKMRRKDGSRLHVSQVR